ncbi:MAG TPA: sugar transferase [Rhodopila sp.]|nr:sugar transferase [Rhodopila sp.]
MSAFNVISFESLAASSSATFAPLSFGTPYPTNPGLRRIQAAVKRLTDIVLAATGLAILGIPMLLLAMVMHLQGDGPVLFRQTRIGLHNRAFTMLKFRTMRVAADEPAATCRQVTRGDPRVTRLGRLLRRTSLDELPQLLNVLAGSMSLVGPRPHAPGTCAAGYPFETLSDRYAERHCVKPGMTGLAQVRGWRGETDTVEKLLHRIDSDLEYIATWSLGRDLLIIGRTVTAVLLMRNAY